MYTYVNTGISDLNVKFVRIWLQLSGDIRIESSEIITLIPICKTMVTNIYFLSDYPFKRTYRS